MIVVDRIEGSRAVVEFDGEMIEIPASALPPGAGEGAVLVFAQGDASSVLADAEARLARLKAKSPPGDVIDLSGDKPR